VDRSARTHSHGCAVTRFVLLLRGVNVGGHNKVPMADLRESLAGDGLASVRTYIQSGNIVLDSTTDEVEIVAARVRSVIARTFGLDIPVIALTAAGLRDVADANPYSTEPDPRRVHAIVLPHPPAAEELAVIGAREEAAAAKGGSDSVCVIGRVAYLHTPNGFGTSELARTLTAGRSNPLADGTARNWATVSALLAMCEADVTGP
jgi:uncharacterized protein (DUF1697 family)